MMPPYRGCDSIGVHELAICQPARQPAGDRPPVQPSLPARSQAPICARGRLTTYASYRPPPPGLGQQGRSIASTTHGLRLCSSNVENLLGRYFFLLYSRGPECPWWVHPLADRAAAGPIWRPATTAGPPHALRPTEAARRRSTLARVPHTVDRGLPRRPRAAELPGPRCTTASRSRNAWRVRFARRAEHIAVNQPYLAAVVRLAPASGGLRRHSLMNLRRCTCRSGRAIARCPDVPGGPETAPRMRTLSR